MLPHYPQCTLTNNFTITRAGRQPCVFYGLGHLHPELLTCLHLDVHKVVKHGPLLVY